MKLLVFIAALALAPFDNSYAQKETDYPEVMRKIASEISLLKKEYPQLSEFSVEKHVQPKALEIEYGHKTHKSERSGGWTSGVPNPDDDGIWFFIDLHDPESTRQIHTQPMTAASLTRAMLGKFAISFLILDGRNNKAVEPEIWKILKRNGVKTIDR